jgi:hypothetical protein
MRKKIIDTDFYATNPLLNAEVMFLEYSTFSKIKNQKNLSGELEKELTYFIIQAVSSI